MNVPKLSPFCQILVIYEKHVDKALKPHIHALQFKKYVISSKYLKKELFFFTYLKA